jgi:DNA repair exonuclease SbcCD ATPase subunit
VTVVQFSLRQLIVQNFRSVSERIVLNFTNTPPGLYYVRGENLSDAALGSNGAGKSTLFSDAVVWVLTGKTARSGRPGKLVENRYADDSTTLVEIEFKTTRCNLYYNPYTKP